MGLLQKVIFFIPLVFLCVSQVNADTASPFVREERHSDSGLTDLNVTINWNHQFQFAGFYAAIAKGFYQKRGLNITVKDWQPGNVDYQSLNEKTPFVVAQSDVLFEIARGKPYKLIMASFQYSPLVLLSHTPIQSLSELANKTVMHNGSVQARTLLQKSFLKTGVPSKVLPSSGNLQDFISGKVDFYGAFKTNEPFILERKNIPYSIIDPKQFGVQSYDSFIITSNTFAQSHPQIVQAFKEATIEGWFYALRHQTEIVDYILANYPVKKTREDLLNEATAVVEYIEPATGLIGQIDLNKLEVLLSDAKKYLGQDYPPFTQQGLEDFIFDHSTYFLAKEEKEFLKKHPIIELGNASDRPPVDFLKNKDYQGVAADYLALIETQLNVKFRANNLPWNQVTSLLDKQEPIVFPSLASSDKRSEDLYFTDPT